MPDAFEGDPYDPDWSPEDNPESGPFFEDGEPSDEELEDIENDEPEFQESMGELLASYEAEQEEFNEAEAEFTEKYGFIHKCRCAQDWDEGNVGIVSMCYLGMVTDAMDTLSATREELKDAKRDVARLRIDLAGA